MKNKKLFPVRGMKNKKFELITISLLIVGVFLLPKTFANASEITPNNLINLTNKERIKYNLEPLSLNEKLKEAAKNKATDLINNQYFAHTSPTGKTFSVWFKDVDYNFIYAGENLAMDFMTAEGVVNAWMDSPSHRKNLLNPFYDEIAIATKYGNFEGRPTIMVAQLFGRQKEKRETLTLLDFDNILDNNKRILFPSILGIDSGQLLYLDRDNSVKKTSLATLTENSPFKKEIHRVDRILNPQVAGVSTIKNVTAPSVVTKIFPIYISLLCMFLLATLSSYAVNLFYKYNYSI